MTTEGGAYNLGTIFQVSPNPVEKYPTPDAQAIATPRTSCSSL